jgi:hypothetical protein
VDDVRETAMPAILGLKCIYDTRKKSWAIDLALEGDEAETVRFAVASAEDVETFIETFEESTAAQYDAENGEVSFSFEYAFADDEDEEEEAADEDEEEDDEESASSKRS